MLWYMYQDKQPMAWMESRIDTDISDELIFNKIEKHSVGTVKSLQHVGTVQYPRAWKLNFDPYIKTYIKINSKWILDTNATSKAVKHLEETSKT